MTGKPMKASGIRPATRKTKPMREPSEVKRLCIKCTRLTTPDGMAYILRGYECMCVGCDAEVSESHDPQDAGENFERRIES